MDVESKRHLIYIHILTTLSSKLCTLQCNMTVFPNCEVTFIVSIMSSKNGKFNCSVVVCSASRSDSDDGSSNMKCLSNDVKCSSSYLLLIPVKKKIIVVMKIRH